MQVIEKLELDNTTVVETEGKVTSQLVFSEVETTVPLNIVEELIFRKPENSNKSAICTGFKYNNEWYFDRPDDGEYRDPFDPSNPVKRIGEAPAKVARITVNETLQGIELIVENIKADYLFNAINWNDQVSDTNVEYNTTVVDEDEGIYTHTFKSSNTLLSYTDLFKLILHQSPSGNPQPDKYYQFKLPAVSVGGNGERVFSKVLPYGDTLEAYLGGSMGSETVTDHIQNGLVGFLDNTVEPNKIYRWNTDNEVFVDDEGNIIKGVIGHDEEGNEIIGEIKGWMNSINTIDLPYVWADGRDINEPAEDLYGKVIPVPPPKPKESEPEPPMET